MGRPAWLVAGVALGVGGTIWLEARVKRQVHQTVQRILPESLAEQARASVRQMGARVQHAVHEGREERDRREHELRRDLGVPGAVRNPGARNGSARGAMLGPQ
jgi:hypothetical protein